MTGLMAESDDEGDGDCDVLEAEDFTSVSEIGNGEFENLACKQFWGFELSDSSVDDIYFCGDCEFDEDPDSDVINCCCEDCNYNPYKFAHMSRKASSHPTDETGSFGVSKHVSEKCILESS